LSRKVKTMGYLMVIVVALSLIAVLYVLMPGCEYCGNKFCFGNCILDLNEDNPAGKNPNFGRLNQTTTRLVETKKMGEDYYDNVYFIGDSRTVALQFYGVPEDHIFAYNGLNHEAAMTSEVVRLTDNKLVDIPEAVMITAPSIMILNFGINGASWMGEDDFMEGYTALVDELHQRSPFSIIVLEAIFPVPSSYTVQENGCSNTKIDRLNERIYEYALEKGYFYMATDEVLKDEYGDLAAGYSSDGTVHLNDAAYAVITDYILRHAIIKE
jgi:hypothetical protein